MSSAVELVAEQGARQTGIRQVIARSSAPRGSFHHYFPGGKSQLVDEAVARSAAVPTTIVRRAHERGESAGQALRATLAWWDQRLRDTDFGAGCPLLAVCADGSLTEQSTQAATAAGFDAWLTEFTDLFEKDGHPRAESRRLATLVVSAVEGAIVVSRALRSLKPLTAVGAELEELLTFPPTATKPTTRAETSL